MTDQERLETIARDIQSSIPEIIEVLQQREYLDECCAEMEKKIEEQQKEMERLQIIEQAYEALKKAL